MEGAATSVLPDQRFRVKLEISPYDLPRGRITYRHKQHSLRGEKDDPSDDDESDAAPDPEDGSGMDVPGAVHGSELLAIL
jgi:hypothetical protein